MSAFRLKKRKQTSCFLAISSSGPETDSRIQEVLYAGSTLPNLPRLEGEPQGSGVSRLAGAGRTQKYSWKNVSQSLRGVDHLEIEQSDTAGEILAVSVIFSC
jgi:hypothetical protein